jgi:hypothetical protein
MRDFFAAVARLDAFANTPSPRPLVSPDPRGEPAPSSENNAASPGVAGGADLCPGCGRPIAECER